MALLQKCVSQFSNISKIQFLLRSNIKIHERLYSVFPPSYVKPIYDKKNIKYMEASGELKEILHLPIKPALTGERSSDFYDPVVEKFICFLTRKGNKLLARSIVEKTFEYIKRIQIECYHKASPDKQEGIELDPKLILKNAIQNCAPTLELIKMRRGGQSYQVPVPIHEKRSRFLAMDWIRQAGMNKEKKVKFFKKLAHELIDAHNNTGRIIQKKQDLYRQCEANRSFAHFRWT